jgi:Snf7
MKNAGAAMKQIHGGLTIDKVDATMDELREQQALGEEIANAITNAPIGEPIDEDDLEAELEGLEQEVMDERMLKTGSVPVTGEVNRLPSVQNGPSEDFELILRLICANVWKQYAESHRRRTRTRKRSCGSCRPRWQHKAGLAQLSSILHPKHMGLSWSGQLSTDAEFPSASSV